MAVNVIRRLAPLLILVLAGGLQAQEVFTYTDTQTGPRNFALGYDVPRPVESLTPVDGFRAYDSLHARHQSLALEHDFIAGHNVGSTLRGRDIFAYVISDPDDERADGFEEGAFQITGGVHAREWQSPEVVTGIIERFAERRGDAGLYDFIVENGRLVVIPVLNVDGFLQAQRFPSRVIVGQDPTNPPEWPRDGRMRRKNMRGADEDLLSLGDHLNGVDLNRNNPPFAPSSLASSNPDSLIYHGGGSQTEPEARALLQATTLAPADRLRLYTDFHSFAASFFDRLTSNSRRNGIHSKLITRATDTLRATGRPYGRRPSGPGPGIGSTDEYFADVFEVPAWTLELEPRNGGTDYGGFGTEHDGFILPDSQVARVRDHIADAYAMLFYAQAGPPAVASVRIRDSSGATVFAGEWQKTGPNRRAFVTTSGAGLAPGGEYELWVAFNKPMRHRDDSGAVVDYPGLSVVAEPGISLVADDLTVDVTGGRWLDEPDTSGAPGYRRYRDDAYAATFTLPADFEPAGAGNMTLEIGTQDLAQQSLDADPSTPVDWGGGHWTGYEGSDGAAGDTGGVDSTVNVSVSATDVDEVAFGATRYEAQEGGFLSVDLTRRGTGDGRVTAELVVDVLFVDEPTEWLRRTITWADGETGDRVASIPMPDDFLVNEGVLALDVLLEIGAVTGPARAAVQDITVDLADNDTPDRRTYAILDPWQFRGFTDPDSGEPFEPNEAEARGIRLCEALRVDGASNARSLRIILADGEVHEVENGPCVHPEGTPLKSVEGRVVIEGNDTIIRLGDNVGDGARLFHVTPAGHLELRGLILESGSPPGNLAGGALLNEGTLVAGDVAFRGNTANRGGAVSNTGGAEFTNTRFVDNVSRQGGGALFNNGNLVLAGATFAGNATDGRGGALLSQGDVTITDSTFSANSAAEGGALASTGSGAIKNSILDGTCFLAGPGSLDSRGYNLTTSASCGLAATGDINAADALLEPVAGDGLLVPEAGSPAVDAGDPAGCLAADAGGAARPFGDGTPVCDIGAVELAPAVHRGMWWNPERSGHGIDLQQARNQLILTWFTYEPDGEPVWYQATATFDGMNWSADLLRFTFDAGENGASGEKVGTVSLEFESAASATFSWDLTMIGQGAGSEPFEPFEPVGGEPQFDATGHFAAADLSDWGLTVDVQGDAMIATTYYYDAAGHPRWVQGVGPAGTRSRMDVDSFTGFCPGCDLTAMPVSVTPAGSQELRFDTRGSGSITTDITYPGGDGGQWQRDIGLGVLSDPPP